MVIGAAGRRIDAPDAAVARFRAERADEVREEIRRALERLGATVLVCSAACGADILSLEAAGSLGVRRRVILPFDRQRFREISVVDRPGDWGARYDSLLDELEPGGDVVTLGLDPRDKNAWTATNDRILTEVQEIAKHLGAGAGALVVWDGKSRGPDDATEHFLRQARAADLPAAEIRLV